MTSRSRRRFTCWVFRCDFLSRGDWKLYLGAGGMVEKCLYAKFGSESVAEKELQWSLTALFGLV